MHEQAYVSSQPLDGYDARRGHNQDDYFTWVRDTADPPRTWRRISADFLAACGPRSQAFWDLWFRP